MTAPWKLIAQAYPCLTCNAKPGERCNSVAGVPQALPHVTRTRLASDNNWMDPDEQPLVDHRPV
jgi:hypothetical protein